MAKAQVEESFNLPVEDLWQLIGDFGDMSKWTGLPPETCVQEGEGVGSHRTLTLSAGGVIIDKLTAETEYSYSYAIVSIETSPLPYKAYRATMSVDAIDEHSSKFTWTGHFEPRGISDEESVKFALNMYGRGIDMMKKAVAKL